MRAALPVLRHFAPDIARLHVLFVRRVNSVRFRLLSHEDAERMRAPGQVYCSRVERELADELGIGAAIMDANVVVSDDVPKEIALYASKVKSRLTFLGASERTLAQRMLYGNPIEQVLRDTTCDVAIYRGIE
jgi:nucleotide-binding universal stress UspA family protein